MAETMELISVLAVEEFEKPRTQSSIDVRNKLVSSLFIKILAYFNSETAFGILSDCMDELLKTNDSFIEDLKKSISNTKQNYIR